MPERQIILKPIDIKEGEFHRLRSSLKELLVSSELDLSDSQVEACVRHLLYVVQVNTYINLTRITDLDEALVLHILDSLLFIPYIKGDASAFLDMGTGAGFPGVPLNIATGISGVLLDSVGKKVNAVNAFIDALGLSGIEGVHDRLESYAESHRASYDLIVARALAPLPILMEYASPLLTRGGQLLVSKGNPTDEEIQRGERAGEICGMTLHRRIDLELPHGLGHRVILDYRREHNPSIRLPRNVGEAKRNPLA